MPDEPAPSDATPLTFIDNPHAPTIFATWATGFLDLHGSVMITLNSVHSSHAGPEPHQSLVEVGRLIMPIRGAQGLALGLFSYLKGLGLDPTEMVTPQDTQPN